MYEFIWLFLPTNTRFFFIHAFLATSVTTMEPPGRWLHLPAASRTSTAVTCHLLQPTLLCDRTGHCIKALDCSYNSSTTTIYLQRPIHDKRHHQKPNRQMSPNHPTPHSARQSTCSPHRYYRPSPSFLPHYHSNLQTLRSHDCNPCCSYQ